VSLAEFQLLVQIRLKTYPQPKEEAMIQVENVYGFDIKPSWMQDPIDQYIFDLNITVDPGSIVQVEFTAFGWGQFYCETWIPHLTAKLLTKTRGGLDSSELVSFYVSGLYQALGTATDPKQNLTFKMEFFNTVDGYRHCELTGLRLFASVLRRGY